MKPVRFRDWDCVVEKSRYGNGRPALILNDAHNGEMIAVATVNLPHADAGPNDVFIKDYSENEGMLKALTDAGVITPTGGKVGAGFVEVPRAELLGPFRERTLGDILSEKTTGSAKEQPQKDRGQER